MANEIEKRNEAFLIYQDENGIARVNVRFEGEDVWLLQEQIMELFDASRQDVSYHINQIYAENEQNPERTRKNFLIVRQEGKRSVKRNMYHYNLDMIIAVGYRVKSQVATRFRQWATQHLREFIQKGFTLDDDRLKGKGNRYFREFRQKLNEGASTLYILGFSFEDDIKNEDIKDYNLGTFHVAKVRMNDDLLQDGLLKKDKAAGSFIIIGEPDIRLVRDDEDTCHVEIQGMDMYDPIQDRVAERNVADIAYWELDDRYSGTEFVVRSIHFCGGDKKEFNAWKKGLQGVAPKGIKRNVERTLRMEFPEDVWDTLYNFRSAPIKYEKGRKLAVRVISQFGEESTKVITLD